jgi:Mg2+-importing ATPase
MSGTEQGLSGIKAPRRLAVIRDFMVFIRPISSIFDFLTFYVLLHYLHASESLFHTGWFVESLATQTQVLFVIRTMGNPFRSRPSRWLTVTMLVIVAIGTALPVSLLATLLGSTRLPASYFAFLIPATLTYPATVDVAKRQLARRLGL